MLKYNQKHEGGVTMDVIVSNHDMIVSCLIAFLISALRSEPNERCMIYFPYYLRQVLFPFRKSDYISVCSIVLRIYAVVSTLCCLFVLWGKSCFRPDYITFILALSVGLAGDVACWTVRVKDEEPLWKKAGAVLLLFFLIGWSCFLVWLLWMM